MAIDLGRLDRFLSDPAIPQAEKDAAVAAARGEQDSGGGFDLGAAGRYAAGKGSQFMGALQRLVSLPGRPEATAGDVASDVLTVGGPVVAPIPALAGTAVGAVTRGLGGDEETADILNAGTQIGTGLVQAGRAAAGVGRAVSRRFAGVAKGATERGSGIVAGSPEGQTLRAALQQSLERFVPTAQEQRVAEDVIGRLGPGAGTTPFGGGGLSYQELDDALTRLSKVPGESHIAGIIRTARGAVLRGTPEAAQLSGATRAARLANMRLPNVARAVVGSGGAGAAGVELYRGRPGHAAMIAGAGLLGATGAGASVGHLLAAAGPLARAGASAGSVLAGSGGDRELETPVQIPNEGEPQQASPPEVAVRTQEPAARTVRYSPQIEAAAAIAKIPPRLLAHVVIPQESGGDVNARSHPEAGQAQTPAHGIMQVTPGTFEDVRSQTEAALGRRASVDNPLDNLLAGAFLWRKYLDKSGGNLRTAAKLYFGGENPTAWGGRTEQYANDIMDRWQATAPRSAAPERVASAGPPPIEDEWRRNLQQRVDAGYITQEQADAAMQR